jgi:hypothetical protein
MASEQALSIELQKAFRQISFIVIGETRANAGG